MLDEILERFNKNIARVENLKSIYGPSRRGRRTVEETDVLRAALVLLHATLEDFLRSLQIWKAATWSEEIVEKFPLSGATKRGGKLTLGALVAHRGKSVDDLIRQSITEHLEAYSSFNDLGQVKEALARTGIVEAVLDAHDYGGLAAMIERRHNIVHRADRNDAVGGSGHHQTKSIGSSHIQRYLEAVKGLRDLVVGQLGS